MSELPNLYPLPWVLRGWGVDIPKDVITGYFYKTEQNSCPQILIEGYLGNDENGGWLVALQSLLNPKKGTKTFNFNKMDPI